LFTTIFRFTCHVLYIFSFSSNLKSILLILEKILFCLPVLLFHENYFSTLFFSLLFIHESSLARRCHISVWILIRPVQKISLFPAYAACRTFTLCYRVHTHVYVVHKRVLCVLSFYILPSAPVQYTQSLSTARISLLRPFPLKLCSLTRALINNTSQG